MDEASKWMFGGIEFNKTTVLGIATILYGCYGLYNQTMTHDDAYEKIILGVGLIFGRSAIQKLEDKPQ